MHTIGIIAEYNPFHSGHRHQLEVLCRSFGPESSLICVMSGNFVQRGDAAIADKWTRTAMALRGGVNLVLELPTPWAVASAETFALGGVSLLHAAGVVDTLSFGSEAGALAPLAAVASCLSSPEYSAALRRELDRGLSFASSRQQAVSALLGEAGDILRTPNNNLGVAYLRALQQLRSPIRPHTLLRAGASHDAPQPPAGGHASASYLRQALLEGTPAALSPYLTPEDIAALGAVGPAALSFCTRGVLAKLRAMTRQDLSALPDGGEGLSARLSAAAQQATCLDSLYALAKSKRYAHARIRRLVLWAFLGLTAEDRPEAPPYLRVLGFDAKGRALLRKMKTAAALPVLVKPAHAGNLTPPGRTLFQLEARCTALYDLCRRDFGRTPGKNEYTQGPVIL